jgi:hypothetical protein
MKKLVGGMRKLRFEQDKILVKLLAKKKLKG